MLEKIGFENIVKKLTKGDFFKIYTYRQPVNVANILILFLKNDDAKKYVSEGINLFGLKGFFKQY